jgi:hypothetical protein
MAAAGVACTGLPGCGFVPEVAPIINHDAKKALFAAVIRGVQCEIRNAIKVELAEWPQLYWLADWSAIIALKLTFDNRFSFNPGVSLKTPMINAHPVVAWDQVLTIPQSYSLGLGAQLEGDMGRSEEVAFFYPFADFKGPPDPDVGLCYRFGALTITGDLKLYDWLDDVLEPVSAARFPASRSSLITMSPTRASGKKYPPTCPPPANPGGDPNLEPRPCCLADLLAACRIYKEGYERIAHYNGTRGAGPAAKQAHTCIGKESRKAPGKRPQPESRPSPEMVFRNLSLSIGSDIRDALRQ